MDLAALPLSPGKNRKLSTPPPHAGQGSAAIAAPLLKYPAACETQREPSSARFKDKLSGEERPEVEPSEVRFQNSVVFFLEAALPAGTLRLATRRLPPPAHAQEVPIYIVLRKRGGSPGAVQRRASTSLNLCPLLSHSPLAWVCPRLLPPSLPLSQLLNKNCNQLPRRSHCPAGPQPLTGSGRPPRPVPQPSAPSPSGAARLLSGSIRSPWTRLGGAQPGDSASCS